MLDAALAAAIAALGLVAGYVLFDRFRPSDPFVGRVMGLGAGVLMAVVAYALVLETTETATRPSIVGIGTAAGALIFYFGSGWLDQRSAKSRKLGDDDAAGGLPLALGAVLDGVPESMVIGIAAVLTGEIRVPLIIAAFIAKIAESLAATPELELGGCPECRCLGFGWPF